MKRDELNKIANQVVDHCNSTNDLARSLGEAGYPHGTWVSAKTQGKGRGRLGRSWTSIEGNLFLSLVLRPPSRDIWSWIPLATAVGAARCLRALFPKSEVLIKWPNDLILSGAKLGGILCEGIGIAQGSFVVVGIGINCVEAPKNLDQPTATLPVADVDFVRPALIRSLLETYEQLFTEGPKPLIHCYENWAYLKPGSKIQWSSPVFSGAVAVSKSRVGTVVGLGPRGELRVSLPSGEETALFAEDVQLAKSSLKSSAG